MTIKLDIEIDLLKEDKIGADHFVNDYYELVVAFCWPKECRCEAVHGGTCAHTEGEGLGGDCDRSPSSMDS